MQINKFSDFNIKIESHSFEGDSIKIHKIFNQEIIIYDFIIEPSEYTKVRLKLSFKFKDEMRITFTSSKGLMEAIQKIDKSGFPFTTIIVKGDNDRYLFT